MKIKELFKKFFSHKVAVVITAVIITLLAAGAVAGAVFLTEEDVEVVETTTTESVASQDEEWTTEETTVAPPVVVDYKIMVNRAMNCLTVYTKDASGNFVPYKAMVCSTGVGGADASTPLGEFTITGKAGWCLMIDDSYTQYACRIIGGIMIHSISYSEMKRDTLFYSRYNQLGVKASHGCIRLCAGDARWIYENCYVGTPVVIYDDYNSPGPLDKPTLPKIASDHPLRGWDPTDWDSNNPWKNYTTYISGDARTFTVANGASVNEILSYFSAGDSLGNNLSSKLSLSGNYSMYTQGVYNVNVVIGGWHPSDSIPITVTVLPPVIQPETTPPETEPPTTAPPVNYTITNSLNEYEFNVTVGTDKSTFLQNNFTASDGTNDMTASLDIDGVYDFNTLNTYSGLFVKIYVGGVAQQSYGPITINVTN